MTDAAMLSAMTVTGTPARASSQLVSREPWSNGRVSSANTCTTLPCSAAARITPSAVPYPAVARAPLAPGPALPRTAEGKPFSDEHLAALLALGRKGIADLLEIQRNALAE